MRISKLLLMFALTMGIASATPYTYFVQVNTPDFGVPGWLDFTFSQVNFGSSLPATATVFDFQSTGFVFDSSIQTSGPGVTGTLPGPLSIPNDEFAANFFTQHVTTWGSMFRFTVAFSGAPGNAAPDGSAFLVSLFDENFGYLVSPLAQSEVANVTINPDGSLTGNGSTFAGGSATVETVPEPGTALLAVGALAALYRRRARA